MVRVCCFCVARTSRLSSERQGQRLSFFKSGPIASRGRVYSCIADAKWKALPFDSRDNPKDGIVLKVFSVSQRG